MALCTEGLLASEREGQGHTPVPTVLPETVQRRVATRPLRRPSPGLGRGPTEAALVQEKRERPCHRGEGASG